MRQAVKDVGEYFRQTGSNAPILSQAEGGECQQNFNILVGDGYWNGSVSDFGDVDGDGYDTTLADVATYYYNTDLSGLPNRVPTQAGINEASHQHLVTYTIAFGIEGTLDLTADPASIVWPNPRTNQAHKIDDMWHAAYNTKGQFFSARQPAELQDSLESTLKDIAKRTATLSALSTNSATLTEDTLV